MSATSHNPTMNPENTGRLELDQLSGEIARAPIADLPRLLGQLRELEATALMRLFAGRQTTEGARTEQLLDIAEAAKRLNVSEEYLYRHWRDLPFAHKFGWGLRFSASGIDEFIRRGGM